MKRKVLSLLLVMAIGMSLLVGCGRNSDNDADNNKGASVNQEENQAGSKDEGNAKTAVLVDLYTDKKIEVSYKKDNEAFLTDIGDILKVAVDTGAILSISYRADNTASSLHSDDVQMMGDSGFTVSELSDYSTAEIKMYGYEIYGEETYGEDYYCFTLLQEVDGGVLVMFNFDSEYSGEEIAEAYAQKVFVSATKCD